MTTQPRRILVTGANRGIGRATVAAILDAAPDTYVFLGSRSPERGEEARDAILADHPDWEERVDVLQIDVSDDASVEAAARAVKDQAPLYAIVNNAGIGRSDAGMATVLDVNTRGPHRVCEAFLPLLDPEQGRVVNVSSASGPKYVAECDPEQRALLTSPDVTWEQIEALIDEELEAGEADAYGLSKACLNAYTIALARNHPNLTINACTPGFIETDMTRPYLEASGATPEEMGMKKPSEGTRAQLHLLFDEVGGSGWYFGSDAKRSPLDRYRSPGDPPYTGD